MLQLFRSIPPVAVATSQQPQWNYLRNCLLGNIQRVKKYNRNYAAPVKSQHFLCRLLDMANVSMSLPLERYAYYVDARSAALSRTMGMTSPISSGDIHRGQFYGLRTPEIIMAVDDYFDFEDAYRNWRKLSPVLPLMHSRSDLGVSLPNGLDWNQEDGLAVIAVNIPMLCVMHRAWVSEQITSAKFSGVGVKSTTHFIAEYVIPNMLDAHMDICLFNRMYNLQLNVDTGKDKLLRKHSVSIPDYTAAVDNCLLKTLDQLSKANLAFDTILKTLPSITTPNIYPALIMPDVLATLQNDWALVATRLKVVDFLIKVAGNDALKKNAMHINAIVRGLIHNNVVANIDLMIPTDALHEFRSYIETIRVSSGRDFLY